MPEAAASKRTLAACSALSCAYFAAIGGFNPYAPLWYKELGLSVFAIGLLVSLASWTRLFAPYAWGALADRRGHRTKIIRWAAAASFASGLGFLLPAPWSSVTSLAVATFLMFTFNAAIVPLMETLVAAHMTTASGGVDTRRYGQVRVWGSIGFLATVVLAGWWFEHFGMKFFAITTLGLLGLVVVAAWRLPEQPEVAHTMQAAAPPISEVMRRPEVRWFFAGVFLTVLAHTALYTFFSLYLDSLGYGKQIVGLLWAASVVVEIAWFAFQGRVMERGNLHQWLIAAALVAALRFALTGAFAGSLVVLLFAQCLHAITFAAQHTACIALVTRYFPGQLRGRGQALYTVLGYGCSGVLGSLAGAWLVSYTGYSAVFFVAAVAALASAFCCWRSLVLDRSGAS